MNKSSNNNNVRKFLNDNNNKFQDLPNTSTTRKNTKRSIINSVVGYFDTKSKNYFERKNAEKKSRNEATRKKAEQKAKNDEKMRIKKMLAEPAPPINYTLRNVLNFDQKQRLMKEKIRIKKENKNMHKQIDENEENYNEEVISGKNAKQNINSMINKNNKQIVQLYKGEVLIAPTYKEKMNRYIKFILYVYNSVGNTHGVPIYFIIFDSIIPEIKNLDACIDDSIITNLKQLHLYQPLKQSYLCLSGDEYSKFEKEVLAESKKNRSSSHLPAIEYDSKDKRYYIYWGDINPVTISSITEKFVFLKEYKTKKYMNGSSRENWYY
jgi:hypothetical protein